MENNTITLVDQDGVEEEFQILHTFSLEDYKKNYVVFFKEGEDEIFVSSVEDDENSDGGLLHDVTDEDEWIKIEDEIERFLADEESEEEE